MRKSGISHGMRRPATFSAAAACAATLALSGCHAAAGGSAASASTAAQAASSGTSGAAGSCNGDYCAPASWDTAVASTPLQQIAPFSEPLNVVISAKSTVPLTQLQQALGNWATVSTATTVSVTGIHIRCISSEMADVTGSGYVPQHVAWRLEGCVGGNDLSLSGNEDHVRIWNQPVPGSRYGAWFAAASFETMCLVKDGELVTAKSDEAYAALHPGAAYHCVDGGPGSIATVHSDGYDDAAQAFSAAIAAAAKAKGWQVSERTVQVRRSATSGEGGVPFSSDVSVLTLTA
jgi:hypothetical protein